MSDSTTDNSLPAEPLTAEHRAIDAGILGIIDGTGSLDALAESLELLRTHIHAEEEILFPQLEADIPMPVFVMKREHGQMWPLLLALLDGCEDATPAKQLQRTARALFQLLQMHNTKEEDVVYAAADRWASEHANAGLLQSMQDAEAPAEWRCAMAPQ